MPLPGRFTPLGVEPKVLFRDMLVMAALALSLFILGFGFRGPGRIHCIAAMGLLLC